MGGMVLSVIDARPPLGLLLNDPRRLYNYCIACPVE